MRIKFNDLVQKLTKQASATTATKSAAGDTPSVTDPADKGTVAVPKDPNAAPALAHIPESATNADVTPVTSVAPARTVDQSKNASLPARAANTVASIRLLMNKKATAAEITPTLPSDKGNDNKNSTPEAAAPNGPAKKQNPDPEAAKTATEQQPGAKAAAEGDAAAKQPGGTPADPEAKKTTMPTPDGKGPIPADKDNTNDVTGKGKKASTDDLAFDPEFHFKIASSLLATEQGRQYAQSLIEAEHGAAEAEAIIKAASFMEEQFNQLQAAEDEGAAVAQQMWDASSPEEKEAAIKIAHAHFIAREALATDMEKQAYDDGAATAATLQDQGALGAGGDPSAGADPAAAGGAGAPPAGGADPSAGGADAGAGGGEVSDDDIVNVLQELVQSGEVKPEEAEAILQALLGGGDQSGGAAPGEQPGMPGGAGAAPAGAAPGGAPGGEDMPPEAKAAAELVKSASAITDAILAPAK